VADAVLGFEMTDHRFDRGAPLGLSASGSATRRIWSRIGLADVAIAVRIGNLAM
jgi:hypothetical protein